MTTVKILLFLKPVIEINYNEKRASWFSRFFGQSSRPSSVDLMKIRIVVTICGKTVTVGICYNCLEFTNSVCVRGEGGFTVYTYKLYVIVCN